MNNVSTSKSGCVCESRQDVVAFKAEIRELALKAVLFIAKAITIGLCLLAVLIVALCFSLVAQHVAVTYPMVGALFTAFSNGFGHLKLVIDVVNMALLGYFALSSLIK